MGCADTMEKINDLKLTIILILIVGLGLLLYVLVYSQGATE
jgi:hypothetical protein